MQGETAWIYIIAWEKIMHVFTAYKKKGAWICFLKRR